MSKALATRAEFNMAAKAPALTESQRRLLADPFSLGEGELAPWIAPAPEWCRSNRDRILAVKGELERGLKPPTPSHIEWCVRKLCTLPSKAGTELDKAFVTDNFFDACGQFPDDLWTYGTTELLKQCTFRPSPSEMVKIVEPKFLERQRMLERVKLMLAPPSAAALPAAQPLQTRAERLQHTRDTWKRLGNTARAAKAERELAKEIGREPEDWARAASTGVENRDKPDLPKLPPPGPAMQAATMRAVARHHREQGHSGYADTLSRQADALDPETRMEPVNEAAA